MSKNSLGGRPTLYTPELAEIICGRLAEGESLRAICADDSVPCVRTVLRWARDNDEFSKAYDDARAAQAEYMDDQVLAAARGATDRESAIVAKVQINAYRWRASKLAPKRFGEATLIKHADAEGNSRTIDDVERMTRLASIFAEIRDASEDTG